MPTAFVQPCDHCQGEVVAMKYPDAGGMRPGWRCRKCGCRWTLSMVLLSKGYFCPVYRSVGALRSPHDPA
jgi:hypothetical protein